MHYKDIFCKVLRPAWEILRGQFRLDNGHLIPNTKQNNVPGGENWAATELPRESRDHHHMQASDRNATSASPGRAITPSATLQESSLTAALCCQDICQGGLSPVEMEGRTSAHLAVRRNSVVARIASRCWTILPKVASGYENLITHGASQQSPISTGIKTL